MIIIIQSIELKSIRQRLQSTKLSWYEVVKTIIFERWTIVVIRRDRTIVTFRCRRRKSIIIEAWSLVRLRDVAFSYLMLRANLLLIFQCQISSIFDLDLMIFDLSTLSIMCRRRRWNWFVSRLIASFVDIKIVTNSAFISIQTSNWARRCDVVTTCWKSIIIKSLWWRWLYSLLMTIILRDSIRDLFNIILFFDSSVLRKSCRKSIIEFIKIKDLSILHRLEDWSTNFSIRLKWAKRKRFFKSREWWEEKNRWFRHWWRIHDWRRFERLSLDKL